jgi:flagellum-specific peptidoglycan hydrolase FlgJ
LNAITSTTQQIVMKALSSNRYFSHLGKLNLPKLVLICILLLLVFNRELDIRFQFNPSSPPGAIATSHATKPETNRSLSGFTSWVKQYWPDWGKVSPGEGKALSTEKIDKFVRSHGHISVAERRKYGVSSSVLVATALLLSEAGEGAVVKGAHNYFLLPCTEDWKGATFMIGDRCLRKYDQAWTSFRDFSFFLTTGKNFQLRELAPTDYEAWARSIGKMDFHGIPGMEDQLLQLIRKYNLYVLDQD